jgi:hypothetical protein
MHSRTRTNVHTCINQGTHHVRSAGAVHHCDLGETGKRKTSRTQPTNPNAQTSWTLGAHAGTWATAASATSCMRHIHKLPGVYSGRPGATALSAPHHCPVGNGTGPSKGRLKAAPRSGGGRWPQPQPAGTTHRHHPHLLRDVHLGEQGGSPLSRRVRQCAASEKDGGHNDAPSHGVGVMVSLKVSSSFEVEDGSAVAAVADSDFPSACHCV